jgi:type IV secretory pathway VirB10-like protein
MRSPIQLFIAIAILLAAATVTAQVYKWVDKDGKTQYTDTPPPSDVKGTAKKIEAKPASGATPVAPPAAPTKDAGKGDAKAGKDAKAKDEPPKTLEERSKAFEKRRAEEADAEKKAAEKAKVDQANQARCNDAKRFVRDIESGRPIGTSDEKGDRKILDDAGRAAELSKARAVVAEACK